MSANEYLESPYKNEEKDNYSLFWKNEASYSFTSGSYDDYLLFGIKSNNKEGGLALKVEDEKINIFGEYKYTSDEVFPNIKVESRTRVGIEKPSLDSEEKNIYATQRFAVKGCWNLNEKWSISETTGVNLNIDLSNGGLSSIGPTSVTSLSHKINKTTSIYTDVTATKLYRPALEKFNKLSFSGTLGIRVNF